MIINVNTEVVSAVAIASALRNAGMPLLVVNCTPAGASRILMESLAQSWGFDLLNLQLASHGTTIDRLMRNLHCDRLLLIDSDAELKSPLVTARMRQSLADSEVYGAGWLQDFEWLSTTQNVVASRMLYHARPWIPCAMFRVSYMRAALNSGKSFNESYLIGPAIQALELDSQYVTDGLPHSVHFDTGAEIHNWAKHNDFRFAGPSISDNENEVAHWHGVSRSVIAPGGSNQTDINAVEQASLERLVTAYGDMWPAFAAAISAASAVVN